MPAFVSEAAAVLSREDNIAWQSRDVPPTQVQEYALAKTKDWLDAGGDINCTTVTAMGHTLLIKACIDNHEVLVAELVKRGAKLDIKAKGKSALHFCCLLTHPSCAKPLLDAGARLDIRVDEDDTEFTECDGMTAMEIVEEKLLGSRDPEASRLHVLKRMLQDATRRS